MGQIKNFIEKLETLKFQNNQLNTPPRQGGGVPKGAMGEFSKFQPIPPVSHVAALI